MTRLHDLFSLSRSSRTHSPIAITPPCYINLSLIFILYESSYPLSLYSYFPPYLTPPSLISFVIRTSTPKIVELQINPFQFLDLLFPSCRWLKSSESMRVVWESVSSRSASFGTFADKTRRLLFERERCSLTSHVIEREREGVNATINDNVSTTRAKKSTLLRYV
jgi:hypothetical protein